MIPMTTPAPVPTPSPQIGASLVTYVLPPLSGKSWAILDAERECPSDCQTFRETGSLAHIAGGEVTHPKLHTLAPCSIFLSFVPQVPLWLPDCPCHSLFCLTRAYLSFSPVSRCLLFSRWPGWTALVGTIPASGAKHQGCPNGSSHSRAWPQRGCLC